MAYKLTHRQFYEGLKDGLVLGLKCNGCGAYTAPPKATCDSCGSLSLEVAQLSSEAQIKTYTIIYVAPEGMDAPYIVAMAELPEGPWLMGNVVDLKPEAAAGLDLIGRKVAIGHRVIPAGNYTAGEGVAVTFTLV